VPLVTFCHVQKGQGLGNGLDRGAKCQQNKNGVSSGCKNKDNDIDRWRGQHSIHRLRGVPTTRGRQGHRRSGPLFRGEQVAFCQSRMARTAWCDTISAVRLRTILKVLFDPGSTVTFISRKCLPRHCKPCPVTMSRSVNTLVRSCMASELVVLRAIRLSELDKNNQIKLKNLRSTLKQDRRHKVF